MGEVHTKVPTRGRDLRSIILARIIYRVNDCVSVTISFFRGQNPDFYYAGGIYTSHSGRLIPQVYTREVPRRGVVCKRAPCIPINTLSNRYIIIIQILSGINMWYGTLCGTL